MKGYYVYVLNPPNGTCHRFHLEDVLIVEEFLTDKGFRLKDIDYMFSQEELIHEG
tara:strand:- start:69 stop:233 length:165 start_codon:yes stop_codon:yes gene_type:complete